MKKLLLLLLTAFSFIGCSSDEDTINDLQPQIDELNTYIANQGAISTKQPNRKARKPYLLEIKNSKKSILSLQQQIERPHDVSSAFQMET